MKYLFTFIALTFLWFSATCQILLDPDSNTLAVVNYNQVVSPNGTVLFTTKGNIVFEGELISQDRILYTLDNHSLMDKKVEVYNAQGQSGDWYAKKGSIYFKDLADRNKVVNISYTTDYLAFYNAANDSLLAYISKPDSLQAATTFAIVQLLWHYYDLETQFQATNERQMPEGMENLVGVIEPVFGNGYIWLWDGRFVYPAYDANPYLVWEFDGEKLSPKLAPRTHEEWRWDVDTFKPFWGGHPKNEWVWQGPILRQIWDANFNKEYLYEEGVIRPRFGGFGDNEWQITGTVPKPVLTAVVLGILFR